MSCKELQIQNSEWDILQELTELWMTRQQPQRYEVHFEKLPVLASDFATSCLNDLQTNTS